MPPRRRTPPVVSAFPSAVHFHEEALWDAWADAAEQSAQAFDGWTAATTEHRSFAFAAYRAALDREEQAAAILAARRAETAGADASWWLGRKAA